MSEALTVRDNPALSRFEMQTEGGTAVALYRAAPGLLTLYHTEVPPALRGRGLASRLVEGVLHQARARGLKVAPRCGFVRRYFDAHPEFHDLLE